MVLLRFGECVILALQGDDMGVHAVAANKIYLGVDPAALPSAGFFNIRGLPKTIGPFLESL